MKLRVVFRVFIMAALMVASQHVHRSKGQVKEALKRPGQGQDWWLIVRWASDLA